MNVFTLNGKVVTADCLQTARSGFQFGSTHRRHFHQIFHGKVAGNAGGVMSGVACISPRADAPPCNLILPVSSRCQRHHAVDQITFNITTETFNMLEKYVVINYSFIYYKSRVYS